MLGRKTFSTDELVAGQLAVAAQLEAFRSLPSAPPGLEGAYFGGMLLALDRRYVHRLRAVTGKATTPLNELEVLAASLIDHGGVLTELSPIKYSATGSVLGFEIGDQIVLTADQFETFAAAVFDELSDKFYG